MTGVDCDLASKLSNPLSHSLNPDTRFGGPIGCSGGNPLAPIPDFQANGMRS